MVKRICHLLAWSAKVGVAFIKMAISFAFLFGYTQTARRSAAFPADFHALAFSCLPHHNPWAIRAKRAKDVKNIGAISRHQPFRLRPNPQLFSGREFGRPNLYQTLYQLIFFFQSVGLISVTALDRGVRQLSWPHPRPFTISNSRYIFGHF